MVTDADRLLRQSIDLVQLACAPENWFTEQTRRRGQAGRAGTFASAGSKRSWRVNDWIWAIRRRDNHPDQGCPDRLLRLRPSPVSARPTRS
jgi:hypothetical protein